MEIVLIEEIISKVSLFDFTLTLGVTLTSDDLETNHS